MMASPSLFWSDRGVVGTGCGGACPCGAWVALHRGPSAPVARSALDADLAGTDTVVVGLKHGGLGLRSGSYPDLGPVHREEQAALSGVFPGGRDEGLHLGGDRPGPLQLSQRRLMPLVVVQQELERRTKLERVALVLRSRQPHLQLREPRDQ